MSLVNPHQVEDLPQTPRSGPQRRPNWTMAIVLTGCLLGSLTALANWEWSAGAAAGTELPGQIPPREQLPKRFRVATFNVHGGYGLDGRLDIPRTAAALRPDIDFFGLNEVRGGSWTDFRSQVEQLGALRQMNWLFAPTETTWSGPHFGQGILSRLPVSSWRRVPFSRVDGNGYRNYVEIQIPLSAGDSVVTRLTIFVTHLDRKSDRQDQLRVLIQRFLEVPPPAILMGDLNSKRTEPQLIRLANESGVIDCFGKFASGDLARRRIDWIFARGLHCLTSNLELTDASDHPWGWAELELPSAVVRAAANVE